MDGVDKGRSSKTRRLTSRLNRVGQQIIGTIGVTLAADETVKMSGFGTFSVRRKGERIAAILRRKDIGLSAACPEEVRRLSNDLRRKAVAFVAGNSIIQLV
ncbi:hypothetical protein DC522_12775 [Microvirga sp. KLBC 81]|uniref:Uncharacterized protein n=1 Tax=Microvirga vignae TaxID=1225564 RepID=A0A0H1RBA5_9HYPH|nr:hypothetical protein AA309_14415 [Microvirga vignae]PVE23978.1 hypothetical protein DC522_12775 [Microvirga sp. KLBC 81]